MPKVAYKVRLDQDVRHVPEVEYYTYVRYDLKKKNNNNNNKNKINK